MVGHASPLVFETGNAALAEPRTGLARLGAWARDHADEMAVLLALFVLWALCNPYYAIDRSSLIYAGRALADLDPNGVGQDIMFRHDGQSGFTIFTLLFHGATARFGPAAANFITAALSVGAAFGGAWALASTFGAARNLAVIFAATLPAYYGGYEIFSYAETAATPRPFTEALVLCGLAALVRGRVWLSIVLMIGAALLHPIMALPGVAVLSLWLATTHRGWALGLLALCAAALVASVAGIAPFDRVTTLIDPQWRAILVDRNPHLFPSVWPDGWEGRAVVRVGTLLIASTLVAPPLRKLIFTTLIVGLGGLGTAYILNERFALEILLQAQTWRAMWLVFALATFAGAVCVIELWPRGGKSRIVLALLALAWVYADVDNLGVLLTIAAVAGHYVLDAERERLPGVVVWGAVATALALCVLGLANKAIALQSAVAGAPLDLTGEARRALALGYDFSPVALVAAVWACVGRPRVPLMITAIAAGIGLVCIGAVWDQRSEANLYFDSGAGTPDLVARIETKPGEVYWIDGVRETWWWLHRPQWVSTIQGASIVFSRDLAVLYRARAERAVALGLADPNILTPLAKTYEHPRRPIAFGNVPAFCAAQDAPAWIVAPLDATAPQPVGLGAILWTAPIDRLEPENTAGALVWRHASRYAVIPCAK